MEKIVQELLEAQSTSHHLGELRCSLADSWQK